MTATIAEQTAIAYFALTNSRQFPVVAEHLAEWGYTAARLDHGLALLDAAKQAINDQNWAAAHAKKETMQAREARTAAWKAYQRVATVARATLRPADALLLTHLGLQHAMPRGANDFLAAAAQLFEGIASTPEAAALLAQYGYSTARLATEQAHITAYRTALHEQQNAIALARRATRAQQTALQSLGRFMSHFWKIASVAFADDPTCMDAIRIRVGTRPKRKDAQDAPNEEIKNEEAQAAEEGTEGTTKPKVVRGDAPAEGDQPASTPSDHIDDQDPSKQQK